MSVVVQFNNQSETLKLNTVFNDYCCTFEETCTLIRKHFNLKNALTQYHMVYYDPSYSTWINFNIHVSNRVTELLRYSSSNTVQIRVEYKPKNISTVSVKEHTFEKSDSQLAPRFKYAHMTIWLDEDIGNSTRHKHLKQICHVMTNTNASFLEYDDINTQIQYSSNEQKTESILQPNIKDLLERSREDSCLYQCVFITCGNTDEFLSFLGLSSAAADSLSLILSARFAKEVLPIFISYMQKQLLPKLSFLYVLCSNIQYYYDWALGYIENNSLDIDTNLQLFDDEKAMFVRLLNGILDHLTSKGDQCRSVQIRKSEAVRYYKAARQLLLNSLPWDDCPIITKLNRLNQLIEETQVIQISTDEYRSFFNNNKQNETVEKFGQQCM